MGCEAFFGIVAQLELELLCDTRWNQKDFSPIHMSITNKPIGIIKGCKSISLSLSGASQSDFSFFVLSQFGQLGQLKITALKSRNSK